MLRIATLLNPGVKAFRCLHEGDVPTQLYGTGYKGNDLTACGYQPLTIADLSQPVESSAMNDHLNNVSTH